MAANAPRATRLHDTISVLLRSQQQRLTPTRKRIVDVLEASDRPLTIPEILVAEPTLAQSSAYRNLVVLEQARVIHRLVTHADFARYELAEDLTEHHHHLLLAKKGSSLHETNFFQWSVGLEFFSQNRLGDVETLMKKN